MRVYFRNYDMGLSLSGPFLLHKPAGIQRSSFEFPFVSGATAKIRYSVKRDTVIFENAETGQKYLTQNQLFSSLQTTQAEFMNRAYAFVDGEARSFCHIMRDLEDRANKTITKALMQIDGVLNVMFMGQRECQGMIIAVREPGKRIPCLTSL